MFNFFMMLMVLCLISLSYFWWSGKVDTVSDRNMLGKVFLRVSSMSAPKLRSSSYKSLKPKLRYLSFNVLGYSSRRLLFSIIVTLMIGIVLISNVLFNRSRIVDDSSYLDAGNTEYSIKGINKEKAHLEEQHYMNILLDNFSDAYIVKANLTTPGVFTDITSRATLSPTQLERTLDETVRRGLLRAQAYVDAGELPYTVFFIVFTISFYVFNVIINIISHVYEVRAEKEAHLLTRLVYLSAQRGTLSSYIAFGVIVKSSKTLYSILERIESESYSRREDSNLYLDKLIALETSETLLSFYNNIKLLLNDDISVLIRSIQRDDMTDSRKNLRQTQKLIKKSVIVGQLSALFVASLLVFYLMMGVMSSVNLGGI